ncbi:MAG: regulatory protein RecX [Caldimonas sp.]
MRQRLSLKGRALQLLAQRDQSRVELRAKLLRHAAAEARASARAFAAAEADDATDAAASGEELRHAEVDTLLDWLEANRFLSAERFVESRVHAREARYGNRRIRAELAQHGVAVSAEMARTLAESELRRATVVCERRFEGPPRDAAERAAQARFLAGRGFSPEVIQRVLRR